MDTKGIKFRHCLLLLLTVSMVEIAGAFTTFGLVKDVGDGGDVPQSFYSGDLDGDGDNDIVAASILDNTVSWFENIDGEGTFGPPQIISSSVNGPVSVAIAQLNGDTYNDIVVAAQNDNTVLWFENLDGNGNFGPAKLISTNVASVISVVPADIDQDTDLDIVAASTGDNAIYWFENVDGSDDFSTPAQTITTDASGVVSIHVADLNSDTYPDVVAALFSSSEVAWYENNDGDGTFGSKNSLSTSVPGVVAVTTGDINSNTRTDIIAASSFDDEIICFFSYDGMGTFNAKITLVNNINGVYSVGVANLDKDTDNDLIATSLVDESLVWYENLNTLGSFGSPNVINDEMTPASTAMLANVDSDSSDDLIFAASSRDVRWINNQSVAPPAALALDLVADPDFDMQFGTYVIGSPRTTQILTLENVGELDLNTSINMLNDVGGAYVIEKLPSSPLRATQSDTLEISYTPTQHGNNNGAFEITTNTASGTVRVYLKGGGVDQLRPTLELDPFPELVNVMSVSNYRVEFSEPVSSFSQFDWLTTGVVINNIQGQGPGYQIQVNFTGGDGPKAFAYKPDTAFDVAGNGNLKSRTVTTVLDTTDPSGTIDSIPGITNTREFKDIRVTFTEPVSLLEPTDFATSGVTVSNIRGNNAHYFVDLTLDGNDGIKQVYLDQDTVTDEVGNGNFASNIIQAVLDETPPEVILAELPDYTNNTMIENYPVNFSEPVLDLSIDDFLTTGMIVTNLEGSVDNYIVDLELTGADGVKEIALLANAVMDTAGNMNELSETESTILDRDSPDVVLDSLPGITNELLITDFGISFSEPVTDLDLNDFDTDGIVVSNLQQNGNNYTVDLTLEGDNGLKSISLPAGSTFDLAGNPNNASNVESITLNTSVPMAMLDDLPTITNADGIDDYGVNSNLNVTGLEISDFATTGLTVTNLRGADNSYLVDLVFSNDDGLKEISLLADSVENISGNMNPASSIKSTIVDRQAPNATLASLPALTNDDSVPSLLLMFDEAVVGLEADDFVTDGITVVSVQGSVSTYSLELSLDQPDGEKTIQLPAGAVTDVAGNSNTTTNISMTVLDSTQPVASLEGMPLTTNDTEVTGLTLSLTEEVVGLEVADFITTGMTVSNLSGSGTSYTFDVELASPDGEKYIQLASNSVLDDAGNGNVISNIALTTLDTTPPVADLTALPEVTDEVLVFNYSVTFSEPVSGIEENDFITTGIEIVSLIGDPNSVTMNLELIGGDGPKSISLPAGSVMDAAGNPNTDSEIQTTILDTTQPVPTFASLPDMTSDVEFTSLTLTFDEEISGLELQDFATNGITVTQLSANEGTTFTMNLVFTGIDGAKEISLPANSVQDIAGNGNVASDTASTFLDRTPPQSMVEVSVPTQLIGTISGTYTVVEEGAGLDHVELFVKEPEGDSYLSAGSISGGIFTYNPSKSGEEAAGVYYFYTIATDNLSNKEQAPASANGDASIELTIEGSNTGGAFWIIQ